MMASKPENLILLVDDDPAKRYTIAKTLIRAGFEVQEASNRRRGPAAGRLSARPGHPRRQAAGHRRLRGLPAHQVRPGDLRDPGAAYLHDLRRSSKTRCTAWTAAPTAI